MRIARILVWVKREAIWLIPAIIVMLSAILHRPNDRFEYVDSFLALDRKTGQLCTTVEGDRQPLPRCSDLARWWTW